MAILHVSSNIKTWMPIPKRTENAGNPVSVCDTETRKKTGSVSVQYRYPNTGNTGIRYFGIVPLLSACPCTTYNKTYGLKANLNGPQPTTYPGFYRLRTSCMLRTLFFLFFLPGIIWFEDMYYGRVCRSS